MTILLFYPPLHEAGVVLLLRRILAMFAVLLTGSAVQSSAN